MAGWRRGRLYWWGDRAAALAPQCTMGSLGPQPPAWLAAPPIANLAGGDAATNQCPVCLDTFTDPRCHSHGLSPGTTVLARQMCFMVAPNPTLHACNATSSSPCIHSPSAQCADALANLGHHSRHKIDCSPHREQSDRPCPHVEVDKRRYLTAARALRPQA